MEWVSVKDDYPNRNQIVLATGHEYDNPENPRWQMVCRFNGNDFESWVDEIASDGGGYWAGECYVTHWMPLPQSPKRE